MGKKQNLHRSQYICLPACLSYCFALLPITRVFECLPQKVIVKSMESLTLLIFGVKALLVGGCMILSLYILFMYSGGIGWGFGGHKGSSSHHFS